MRLKMAGAFLAGVLLTVLLHWPAGLLGQGPSGFTKVGSSTATSYSDATVVSGGLYQYGVTATNAAGESASSVIVSAAIIPQGAGPHHVNLTWNASTGATGYNVYRFLVQVVQVPVAPVGLAAAVD
jgi:hypothetical protein